MTRDFLEHYIRVTLETCSGPVACYDTGMKFLLALVVWFVIAAILVTGIVMTVTGKHLVFTGDLFIAGLLVYIGMFSKYGCLSH